MDNNFFVIVTSGLRMEHPLSLTYALADPAWQKIKRRAFHNKNLETAS